MNSKGFTLIEVLLAIFIIVVGLLALYSAVNYSFGSIQRAKDHFTASYLAQEGIEIVKNIRDSNFVADNDWNLNLLDCDSEFGCRADYNDTTLTENTNEQESLIPLLMNEDGIYNYSEGTYTVFSRRIFIEAEGSDKLNLSVVIRWGSNEFLLEESLYNWK